MKPYKVALIGRSGSGKSSLIEYLRSDKEVELPIISETARDILQTYPHYSMTQRQYKMLYLQLGSEQDFIRDLGGFITDRGLHDYCVYSNEVGLGTKFYNEQLDSRYDLVLKMPNRPFNPEGRVERDEQEASRLQSLIDEKYLTTKHEIIDIPDLPIKAQGVFVKNLIKYLK